MKPLVITFDVDGVLADFVYGFTSAANRMFGSPVYTSHEQKRWDDIAGLSPKAMGKVWEYIKASPTFWQELSPLAERDEFDDIFGLEADGHAVYFTTARPGLRTRQQTEQWLRYYIGLPNPSVMVTSKKGEAAATFGADFAIDDKAGNAVYIAYQSPKTRSFIIDRQYNRFDHSVIGSKVTRVKTVTEFLKAVRA